MTHDEKPVKRRSETFCKRPVTKIVDEVPCAHNPYIAKQVRCYGYDVLDLMEKRSFVDVLYLLFRGELPGKNQARLLESLMIALAHPGPRHPATRAAMNVAVSKTNVAHFLPISLSILGGEFLGAAEVENSMRFLRKNLRLSPEEVVAHQVLNGERPLEGDWHPFPGFGSRFGSVDEIPDAIAKRLANQPGAGKALHWGNVLAAQLRESGMGWLSTGVAAAVLTDLGFNARSGAGLYQLLSAPGLLAQGVEMANKPLTAMPFLTDEEYIIEND
jgi:citrate synthase